jgi:hypothetical protein
MMGNVLEQYQSPGRRKFLDAQRIPLETASHAKIALLIPPQKLDPHPRRTALAKPTSMEMPLRRVAHALLVLMVARLLLRHPQLLLWLLIASARPTTTMMAAHAKSALIIPPQKLDPHPRRTAIAMPTFMETPKTARDALLVLMVARLLLRHPPLLLWLLIASV